jgi:hypothetical protein
MREADDELRALELERVDALVGRLWPLIDRDDPDLKALDRYMKVVEYRAKIAGLYAPRRQQVQVAVQARVEHRKLEAYRILEADAAIAQVIDEHITRTPETGSADNDD